MGRYSALRASDADREHIAERLREAAAEGRLLAEELEQRLGAALRARTYGELDAVVADLPGTPRKASRSSKLLVRSALGLAIVVAATLVIAVIAVLVISGAIVVWGLWIMCAWWCLGGRHAHRRRRALRRGGRWQVSRHADRRAWL